MDTTATVCDLAVLDNSIDLGNQPMVRHLAEFTLARKETCHDLTDATVHHQGQAKQIPVQDTSGDLRRHDVH